jgi:hypothetical protein
MDVQITYEIKKDHGHHIEMQCGNKAAYVFFSHRNHMIVVCCLNNMHSAWKGPGKSYTSWEFAKMAYKSLEMLAMIDAAKERIQP